MLAPDHPAAPERLTTSEVLTLLRISRATLWRRIAEDRLPRPLDRGRQALFAKEAVLEAAGRDDRRLRSHTTATQARLEALKRRSRRVHPSLGGRS